MDTTAHAHEPKTIVLLDPTSVDGESALELLDREDFHVAIVVLLWGRMSSALREFAASEETDVSTVGWIYLDQVAERVSAEGRVIETILASGPDPALELTQLVAMNPARRVLIPSSLERLDVAAHQRLLDGLSIPVVSPSRVGAS